MTKIKLAVYNQAGQLKTMPGQNGEDLPMEAVGEDFVDLACRNFQYEEGDEIVVEVAKSQVYLMVKLDETLDTTLIYVPNKLWRYQISLTQNARQARCDQRFMSQRHYLQVRLATAAEINSYRNLALNPHDQKEFTGAYPHAFANVETRNDATFFACNAIDGVFANFNHGDYPYQSWGINQQADAALTIDFGRKVLLDKVAFTLRNDFPHDSYWQEVSLYFSDDSKETFQLAKVSYPQSFSFTKRVVTKVVFKDLQQASDPSPFPALTQIEFFGYNQS